jgi:hypothetical protein
MFVANDVYRNEIRTVPQHDKTFRYDGKTMFAMVSTSKSILSFLYMLLPFNCLQIHIFYWDNFPGKEKVSKRKGRCQDIYGGKLNKLSLSYLNEIKT